MTRVISTSAPASLPTTEGSSDPPTIKGAGRLDSPGTDILGGGLAALLFLLIAVGPLMQAVLTSQDRSRRGIALNAATGAAALVVFVGASLAVDGGDGILEFTLITGVIWTFLAVLAAIVGANFRPKGRLKRPA